MKVLGSAALSQMRALLDEHHVTGLLAAQHLGEVDSRPGGAHMLGVDGPDGLRALAWSGYNFVPVGDPEAMPLIARHVRRRGRRASSIVGSRPAVERLWKELDGAWGRPRERRMSQPALVIRGGPVVVGDVRVRPAEERDLPLLLPASVAMFAEEVGYDPTRGGGGYAQYVQGLVAKRRSFVVIEPVRGEPTVIFKADVGALWNGMAQIQGVWTLPELRGQGVGTAAMAQTVTLVQRALAPVVSLYVNDFNEAARHVYEKVGFSQEGTYATIMF